MWIVNRECVVGVRHTTAFAKCNLFKTKIPCVTEESNKSYVWIKGSRDSGPDVSVKMKRKDIRKELLRLDGYSRDENNVYEVEVRVPPSRLLHIESGECLTLHLPRLRLLAHIGGSRSTRDVPLSKYLARTFVCSVRLITNRTKNSNYIHRAHVKISTMETF